MSEIQQFSQHDIEVLNEETVYKGFFTLKKVQFKHKLFAGGESGVVTRELLVKGAASAVIAYDPKEDSVVLVEQVRIGAYQPGSARSPWLLELIAGRSKRVNNLKKWLCVKVKRKRVYQFKTLLIV